MTSPERCYEAEDNLRIVFPRVAFTAFWSEEHITTLNVAAIGLKDDVEALVKRIRELTGHQPRYQNEGEVSRAFFTLSQFHREELFRED